MDGLTVVQMNLRSFVQAMGLKVQKLLRDIMAGKRWLRSFMLFLEVGDHMGVFLKMVVPPKHPKLVIFSRKTQ